ncbi:hypothetical protein BB559_001254 [Furculomyces boomerangus]|uniref:Leucine carboxyl methyltransferase 1 n=2 Tax=Harpellales TaxID=61421 RepID=A0A2T9YTK9_9FUNG|nr:hypothetical protein BB559_002632 [Furculomyces boomerangus]PVU98809.1 hypothetical protein BB559_001254 [Furculomyces boomerangus]PWA01888.1 hypothetical protein BB558_002010 [Smittium angustum]
MSKNELKTEKDIYIQKTCEDAAKTRLCAGDKGYLNDEFIKYFVKKKQKFSPIMNRGTFCRFYGIQNIISSFVDTFVNEKCQVVSLGSGYDTSYFINKQRYIKRLGIQNNDALKFCKFFDIDFASVNKSKIEIISKTKPLLNFFDDSINISSDSTELDSRDYSIISGDLRAFQPTIVKKLEKNGFDSSIPTLVLAECVLVYLDPKYSNAIVDWMDKSLDSVLFFSYEQINPFDRFGQQMIENLRNRNIELYGLTSLPTLEHQKNRFLGDRKWQYADSVDLWTFYNTILPQDEMKRIRKLEFLDENEELNLLLEHYCFTHAYKSKNMEIVEKFKVTRFY